MNGLPMMPWYPRDFRSSTLTWPWSARAAYRELLDVQWDVGGLPEDPEELREIARCPESEWPKAWRYCEHKFPIGEGGLRRNPRLEAHRSDSFGRQIKAKKKAAHAAGVRWKGNAPSNAPSIPPGNPQALPEHMLEQCPPSPSPSPSPPSLEFPIGNSRARARSSSVKPTEFEQQVIDAYHRLLPDHPRVKCWNRKRRSALSARIAERKQDGKQADTGAYWEAFFEHVAASDFLCGRKTDFRCDLPWLLGPENFLKVIEGRYSSRDRGSANGGAAHAS